MKTTKEISGVKLYTIPEIAGLLQINSLTVRRYIKAGRLRANRIGRPLLITEDDLRRFLTGTIEKAS